jgi:pimeloyl-ACP methyl ester carboxylesterase
MPTVNRPDGARIHWLPRGEGPLVLICQVLWSYPDVYEDFIADLARDHCVVVYDPRGCGNSSREGPYDIETDEADLEAVADTAGGGAVAIAVGDCFNRAVRLASARPELISRVLAVGPAASFVLPRSELRRSGGLAGSDSVAEMIVQMLTTEPRAAMRTLIATTNPDLDEAALHDRLERVSEYASPEAVLGRIQAWLADDVGEQARALGERLWILHAGDDALFEGSSTARVGELFPEAHVEEFPYGLVSNPHLAAQVVRRVTAGSPGNLGPAETGRSN